MIQVRKNYRKSYTSSGQLYVGGELLDFRSYDISVKGILIEILPGLLLTEIGDFETLIEENNSVEIFVKDLFLTGEAQIVWAKLDNGKIMLGLEFRNVNYKAEKLWRKRNYFRCRKNFSGYLMIDDRKVEFEGVNVSVDGLAMQLDHIDNMLTPGYLIKLLVNDIGVKGVGKIVWVNTTDEMTSTLGLKYLTME